jgi:osmotically-inducible protein OsmY
MTSVTSDIGIQTDILDELEFDPEVTVTNVGVEVDDGVVTLTGTVDTYTEKIAAEHAALRVAGVRALANDLVVAPEVAGVLTDTEIATRIADAFDLDTAVPAGIIARVEDGRVTLHGQTVWHHQRAAAESTARQIAGVRSVTNQIRIVQPAIAPHTVETQIFRALVRHAVVDAQQIAVAIDGSQVTLSGTVRTWAERQEATAAAWRVGGVTEVVNHIAVRPIVPM